MGCKDGVRQDVEATTLWLRAVLKVLPERSERLAEGVEVCALSRKKPCLSQSGSKVVDQSADEVTATTEVKTAKEPATKDSVSVIIYMRVQRMLCQLEMKTMSDASLCDEAKFTRSERITILLISMMEVKREEINLLLIDRLKSLVLKAILAVLKKMDNDLACELFKVFSEGCLCEETLSSDE